MPGELAKPYPESPDLNITAGGAEVNATMREVNRWPPPPASALVKPRKVPDRLPRKPAVKFLCPSRAIGLPGLEHATSDKTKQSDALTLVKCCGLQGSTSCRKPFRSPPSCRKISEPQFPCRGAAKALV